MLHPFNVCIVVFIYDFLTDCFFLCVQIDVCWSFVRLLENIFVLILPYITNACWSFARLLENIFMLVLPYITNACWIFGTLLQHILQLSLQFIEALIQWNFNYHGKNVVKNNETAEEGEGRIEELPRFNQDEIKKIEDEPKDAENNIKETSTVEIDAGHAKDLLRFKQDEVQNIKDEPNVTTVKVINRVTNNKKESLTGEASEVPKKQVSDLITVFLFEKPKVATAKDQAVSNSQSQSGSKTSSCKPPVSGRKTSKSVRHDMVVTNRVANNKKDILTGQASEVPKKQVSDLCGPILFKKPQEATGAQRGLKLVGHIIDNHGLVETKMKPASSMDIIPFSTEAPVTEEKLRTVNITGISVKTTKDALLNFFENKRRSGGGEIEDIQYNQDEGIAEITFYSTKDAENVCQTDGLELDGAKLATSLKEILPKDPYKLHIMGLSEKTTKDGLLSYIEVVSGAGVKTMLFGSDYNVMVTFEKPPDLEKIHKRCRMRPLDGNHLQVKQVSISDCITVSGLDSNTTRDTILYYFENPSKSGGGDVKNVQYVNGETKAVVFFEDPLVVDRVVTHEHAHVINGKTLQVLPHYPFLGVTSDEPGGGKKETKLKVDPQAIPFINKFFQHEFEILLQSNEVQLNQEEGKGQVVLVSINNKMDRVKWDSSCEVIEKYINQITTREVEVSSAAWEETIQHTKHKISKALDKIHIVFKDEQRILLKGKQQDVDELAKQLEDSSQEINKKIKYEKDKITEKIDLTKPQLDLLNFVDAIEKLKVRLKDLEVRIDKQDMAIHFRGPDAVVKEGNKLIWQYISEMKDQEIELPRSVVSILTSDAGNVFVSKHLKDQHIEAVISSSDGKDDTRQLLVTAVDRKDVKKAIDFIKKTTGEASVPLTPHQKSLILSIEGTKLISDLEECRLLKVTTDPGSKCVRLYGIKEEVNISKIQVLNFLKENTIISVTVEADAVHTKYLLRFKQDEVTKIEDEFKQHSVYITQNSNGEGFKISGTKEGTEKATKKVLQLVNQIKDKSIEIEKPSIKKLFSVSKGQILLSNIEVDHTCIIEQCSSFDENNMNTAFSKSLTDSVTTADVGNIPRRKRARVDKYDQPFLKAIPGAHNKATTTDIKITIIKDDLAKEKTHAIVNTVASDLDLSKNPCAKALSNAAGPQLQQECKGKGHLKPGDVFVTEGYDLGCKNVFHVVAGDWKNGNGEKVLRDLIVSCLKEADKRGFSSIAFPAIGTGNLGFPRDVVAKVFFEEVNSFKKNHPKTSVLEVRFVLFRRDQPTIDAFQKEQKNWDKPSNGKGENKPFQDWKKYFIGSVRIDLISGDITTESTIAIATPSNQALVIARGGGVGAAIARAGGPSIQKECDKLGPQTPGSVVCTSAGTLPSQKLFHLNAASFSPSDTTDVVLKCLKMAESQEIGSIAIPAVGTGNAKISPKEAAKALLIAVENFCKTKPTSLQHIRIVVFQEHMLQDFHRAIEELEKTKLSFGSSVKFSSWLKRADKCEDKVKALGFSHFDEVDVDGMAVGKSSSSTHQMYLKVFASSESNLKEADTAIKELIKEQSKRKTIVKPAIEGLSQTQEQRILRLQEKYFTEIEIHKRSAKIIISGLSEDLTDTVAAIYEILDEKTEAEHERRIAELVSTTVQWHYDLDENGERDAYDDITNAKIEKAFKEKKDSVMITLVDENNKEVEYKIVFATMKEINLDTGNETDVHREEPVKDIPLPHHWDAQPNDPNGKEKDFHLVQLDPAKNQHEYDGVLAAISNSSAINIVKIERVQNPELYSYYMHKKQKMDDKDGSNEKKLFHGTAVDTCNLINHKGFNRSYCGKNATLYGKGVYFARDASYSMQDKYSPPDSNGNRCMYLASVLVGQFTVGNQNMIEPPPKDPNNPTITYDTTVNNVSNPQVFVAYHDIQVYPEYLITFK